LILVVAFLLLVSFVISAALAAVGKWVSNFGPAGLSETVMQTIGILASWIVIAALFAAIFQVLPDARIEWRHVGLGAAITSALFTIGKTFIGLYVGKSGMSSAYGAAGSLVVIVFWLYYASLILLMGAEFTKIWAAAHGHTIEPEPEAIKVTTQELRHA
jgi:membrane protein